MEQDAPAGLESELADDPEMAELIELFVGDLPRRMESLRSAFEQADAESLRRLAHQMKGSAPGYGFPTIGRAAGELEATLRQAPPPEDGLERARAQLDGLIELCERARA